MIDIGAIQGIPLNKVLEQNGAGLNKKNVPRFSETLQGMIQQVDDLHTAKHQAVQDFIAGKDVQLHEVMAIGEEAQISFQFMLEMRNKVMEAYHEISRMQV